MLLDSVSITQSDSTWIVAAFALLAALIGASAGAVLGLLMDLWRRALDGVSASRMIRFEIFTNANTVSLALQNLRKLPPVTARTWRERNILIAPLIDEVPLSKISRDMEMVDTVQGWIDDERDVHRDDLREWLSDLDGHIKTLRDLEYSSKWRLMMRLLLHVRPATRDELVEGYSSDLPH